MRAELLSHLRPEFTQKLERFAGDDKQVEEGVLRGPTAWWPVVRGVPCFLTGELRPDLSDFEKKYGLTSAAGAKREARDAEQAKTTVTFSDKWRRFKNYGLEQEHQAFLRGWYCKKLGLADETALRQFYHHKNSILVLCPGSGFNSRFMAENCPGTVIAADISEAAHTTYGNTKDLPNAHVVQADVMNLPFPDNHFDFAIADGVLHHTPDTRAAVAAMYSKVKPGGLGRLCFFSKSDRSGRSSPVRKHGTPRTTGHHAPVHCRTPSSICLSSPAKRSSVCVNSGRKWASNSARMVELPNPFSQRSHGRHGQKTLQSLSLPRRG